MDCEVIMRNKGIELLWVDDEIRKYSAYIVELEKHGFHVYAASTAHEAITIAHQRRFDVILADILMPPPDGMDFFHEVHAIQPDASFAILSGYLDNNIYRDKIRELPYHVELLHKPLPITNSPNFEVDFVGPLKRMTTPHNKIDSSDNALPKQKKRTIWSRLSSAVEVKPSWFGMSVDLKKLFAGKRRNKI